MLLSSNLTKIIKLDGRAVRLLTSAWSGYRYSFFPEIDQKTVLQHLKRLKISLNWRKLVTLEKKKAVVGRQMKSSSTILGYKFLTQAGDLKSSPIWRVNQDIGNTAEGIACCLFKMASSDLDPSLLRYLLGGGEVLKFGLEGSVLLKPWHP